MPLRSQEDARRYSEGARESRRMLADLGHGLRPPVGSTLPGEKQSGNYWTPGHSTVYEGPFPV